MSNCICGNDDCVLCEAVLKADLPQREICEIQGLINKETYKQGEVLFREGDPCHYFFILTMGHAKLVMSLDDGREQIIGLGVPGRLLGFQHLDGQKYTYSAIATAPVSVCKVRYKHMLKVLEQHPRTAIRVINVLNSELRQTQYMMSVMGRKTVSEKLATFILSLMPRNKSNQNVVDLPLSRLEIAEILGLREETICRTMANLKRKAIIQTPRGKIIILKLERLKTIAKGESIKTVPTLLSR